MKMKLNRILATLLLAVTLFSSVSVLAPIASKAAGSEAFVADANAYVDSKALESILGESLKGNKTAHEALYADYIGSRQLDENGDFKKDEQGNVIGFSYLDSYMTSDFAIYVNRFTGVLYYMNRKTGQLLTSNPTDHGAGTNTAKILMSQIEYRLLENANLYGVSSPSYSYIEAAERGQISVSSIQNGLRVNYAMGITDSRYLLPAELTSERFDSLYLRPFVTIVQGAWESDAKTGALKAKYGKIDSKYINNANALTQSENGRRIFNSDTVIQYISTILSEYASLALIDAEQYDATYQQIQKIYDLLNEYSFRNGKFILDPDMTTYSKEAQAKALHALIPEYTFETMFADEKAAGYVQLVTHIPVVRLALEYTLNADGSLNVTLPANSIMFDESYYTLDYIKVLPYFGAAKRSEAVILKDGDGNALKNEDGTLKKETVNFDGYLFYPDGSGMILDFSDFRTQTFSLTKNIYGVDSGYSSLETTKDIDIDFNGESITMPVYGMVNEVKTATNSSDTVYNGFLAIMEDGAAMSTLTYKTDANHTYLSVYPTYTPYPKDVYNLSSTLSVSGLSSYTIVSDSRYTGVYNTRFVMLTDPALKEDADPSKYYEASYVGMAAYYRDYLLKNGTLKELENLKKDIPLYVESFGAMDILGRFLTFPVTKSIPLTTFDDVATMYADFSAAGVKNVNFRLNGFANGGLNATYPVKSRWESACGGARDLKKLLAIANEQTGDNNLGLYPEFDFMYLNNSAAFDGMSMKGNVACMVDNRYASKQVFGSALNERTKIRSFVITADALSDLYAKFTKKYGKYEIKGVSVSTLGTDLNSNFDKKNSVNREQSKEYVVSLLGQMSNEYRLMLDGGNAYTLQYASHILNIATDSSHYRYSSYPVPFIGMVLHGYVSYAGAPLNYAGNENYDALRFIENGAAPYYILAYNEDNIKKLKEDENLSKYYGVSYTTWKDTVVKNYNYINSAIGGLQDYQITDHVVLVAERVLDHEEDRTLFDSQEKIFFAAAKASIDEKISDKLIEMKAASQEGVGLKVTIDRDALAAIFFAESQRDAADTKYSAFKVDLEAFCKKIEDNYNGMSVACDPVKHASTEVPCGCAPVELPINTCDVDFSSYVTESEASNKADYNKTTYTVDNGNVVMVTYQKGAETVNFILNYNSYAVTVRMNGEQVKVESYAYTLYNKEG